MEEAVLYAALCPLGKEHQAAWDLLALVLAREAGLSALPEVAKGEEGKPFFPGRPDICFNLSHSHGAVACAVHNRDIGVDIELVRQPPKLLGQGMEPEAFFRLVDGPGGHGEAAGPGHCRTDVWGGDGPVVPELFQPASRLDRDGVPVGGSSGADCSGGQIAA